MMCKIAMLKYKDWHRMLLPHPLLTIACFLRVLQVHKTTVHQHGRLKELTFFPR